MSLFFKRLQHERKKIGLSQEEFATLAGVKKRAQQNYEKGERKPDTEYLEALHEAGVDVAYLITGEPNQAALPPSLAADEQLLLDTYRTLPIARRREMLTTLITGESSKKKANATESAVSVGSIKGSKNSVNIGSIKTKL